ncbi:MAG: hypothetical protein JW969_03865 [Spirochaetales bacterium]|nr:hypothetical protein [Spirochaetales bacterium]
MKRIVRIIFLIFFFFYALLVSVNSEEMSNMAKMYVRSFNAAVSLDTRITIVKDAESQKRDDLGPLYKEAIDYLVNNYELIGGAGQKITTLTITSLDEIERLKYTEANMLIWRLFEITTDMYISVRILEILPTIGKGDEYILKMVNRWIDIQNSQFQGGKPVDEHLLTLGLLVVKSFADGSSFPYAFKSSILGYTKITTQTAKETLFALKTDFKEQAINIIMNYTFIEKKRILEFSLETSALTDTQKGEIAQFALEVALKEINSSKGDQKIAKQTRLVAVDGISKLEWDKAVDIVIEHHKRTRDEYTHGMFIKSSKSDLLESIACVGNLKAEKAAIALSNYLHQLNDYTETVKVADEQIVMVLLSSLGKIGNPLAYDDMKYVQFLNYTDIVKKTSRDALKNLK